MAKAITKTARFFNGLLSLLIISGFISAGGLLYLGFDKANRAENNIIAVDDLYITYGSRYSITESAEQSIEEIIREILPDNKILDTVESTLTDDTIPEAIVNSVYSGYLISISNNQEPSVSSSIAKRILVHRIKKAYDTQELTAIICGINASS